MQSNGIMWRTADVGASTVGNIEVKVIARTACILSKEALSVCLAESPLQR